jgi:hypothetical protein
MRNEKIVLDRTRLENAPSFEESNFPNLASGTWSSAADRYWGRARTAAAEPTMDTETETSSTPDTAGQEDQEPESVPETSQPPY